MTAPHRPLDALPTWQTCTDALVDVYRSVAAERGLIRR